MASSDLRSRTQGSHKRRENAQTLFRPSPSEVSPTALKSNDSASDIEEDYTRVSLLDILRVLGGLFLLLSTLSYFITGNSITWNYRPPFTRPARIKAWLRGPLHLTDAQLSLYNGTDPDLPILLAVNGKIYDVSASPHFYGPGGSYHFFAGRDATRSFVTGCFDTDLTGDLRGVEEMFISTDLTDPTIDESTLQKEQKRERKLRKERETRLAKKKVEETVKGWERMFDGGKEGRYFRVGKVDRGPESGWEGWGELKELCEKAREGRPRKTAEEVG